MLHLHCLRGCQFGILVYNQPTYANPAVLREMNLAPNSACQLPEKIRDEHAAAATIRGSAAAGDCLPASAISPGRGARLRGLGHSTCDRRRHGGTRGDALGRDAATIAAINASGENARHLPGIALPAGITATTDLARAVSAADAVLLVTPSTTLRALCLRIAPLATRGQPVAICAKGIERQTGLLLSQVVAEAMRGHAVGAISGPTFAREIALGHPAAATVAFRSARLITSGPRAASPRGWPSPCSQTGSFPMCRMM